MHFKMFLLNLQYYYYILRYCISIVLLEFHVNCWDVCYCMHYGCTFAKTLQLQRQQQRQLQLQRQKRYRCVFVRPVARTPSFPTAADA